MSSKSRKSSKSRAPRKSQSQVGRSRKSHRSPRSKSSADKVVLPRPEKGALGDYSTKNPAAERRVSLKKSVRDKGYATTMREINIRATLNKTTNPGIARKMKSDMEYLRKNKAGQ